VSRSGRETRKRENLENVKVGKDIKQVILKYSNSKCPSEGEARGTGCFHCEAAKKAFGGSLNTRPPVEGQGTRKEAVSHKTQEKLTRCASGECVDLQTEKKA